jgi:hypothetical protein
VYANVNKGGVQGIFFDYPERVFPERGGLEDRYATALAAYRNVFRIAREGMGPDAYLQERMGIGSDATLDQVSSVRTAGDNNELRTDYVRNVALRWYKNRLLTNYDMDGKALLVAGVGRHTKLTREQRRAVLTVSYALTGRLLLTESFRLFDADVLHDLSRVFPFHATPLTARPLDAFLRDIPTLYDFPISGDWHQLVIYNAGKKPNQWTVPFSGDTADAGLGLDPAAAYHVYDFWNNTFIGTFKGTGALKQTLRPGEARMLSIRKVGRHPQVLSTNRHIMQGYYELSDVKWEKNRLSGKAKVVAVEPLKIVIALNGRQPADPNLKLSADGQIAVLTIDRPKNETTEWSLSFQ